MEKGLRRYDIDWLRVIAIGLLIIYHTGIGFQPWGVLIGFIQNNTPMKALWVPMSMMNIWRIPLLFFVSGMGVSFSLRRRTIIQLFRERTVRILLPFLFGIVAIVPVHLLLWQRYYSQDLTYSLQQSHLWFLGNIFSYVIILSPLFLLAKKNNGGKISSLLARIFSSPFGILLVMLAFVAEVMLVRPDSFEMYAMTFHGYMMGLLAFIFGYTLISFGNNFWETVKRWRWVYLSIALLLFLVRYKFFDLQSPLYLKAVEMVAWIFSAFGFAYRYFNKSSRALHYLSRAAYPVYILHMIFLYLASYFIMPTGLPVALKFVVVSVLTFAACFAFYEIIIRRIRFLRPLFGLGFK